MTFEELKNEVVEDINARKIDGEKICLKLAELMPGDGRPEGFDYLGDSGLALDIAEKIYPNEDARNDEALVVIYSVGLINARKHNIDILALRKACNIDGLKKKYRS